MKHSRVMLAAAVLFGIALLTVYSVMTVRSSCNLLIADTERIMSAAVSGETNAAHQEIAQLRSDWTAQNGSLRLFIPNERLSELNQAVFRLEPLCDAGCDELTAELQAIRAALDWIRRNELSFL